VVALHGTRARLFSLFTFILFTSSKIPSLCKLHRLSFSTYGFKTKHKNVEIDAPPAACNCGLDTPPPINTKSNYICSTTGSAQAL
jgi:hypothetical protein